MMIKKNTMQIKSAIIDEEVSNDEKTSSVDYDMNLFSEISSNSDESEDSTKTVTA